MQAVKVHVEHGDTQTRITIISRKQQVLLVQVVAVPPGECNPLLHGVHEEELLS